jgi:hypothetical protein
VLQRCGVRISTLRPDRLRKSPALSSTSGALAQSTDRAARRFGFSVLSALEGVNVATEVLEPYIMPAAVAILACLFAVQGRGTARIGKVFGP